MTGNSRYYYDNNGNMTAKQSISLTSGAVSGNAAISGRTTNTGTEIYQYDLFNRLVRYNSGAAEASYTYNANNLRASKKVNGTKTEFTWNGQNLAKESNSSGTNVYTYDMTGIHIANNNGTIQSCLKDSHGNVVGMADENGSKNDDVFEYTAYGENLANVPAPFGYCGEYYDSESGLIYLRNRYYNTSIGRFITEDPIKDGLNWYAYCGGNPVMFVDPSGEDPNPTDELVLRRLLMDLLQKKVDYENTHDVNVTSGASIIKEDIMKLSIVENNEGLKQQISEVIYGENGSSIQEVSSLFKVIQYFEQKHMESTSAFIQQEIQNVSYEELHTIYLSSLSEIDGNSLYYVSDMYDINETRARALLDSWLGCDMKVKGWFLTGNGRAAVRVDRE